MNTAFKNLALLCVASTLLFPVCVAATETDRGKSPPALNQQPAVASCRALTNKILVSLNSFESKRDEIRDLLTRISEFSSTDREVFHSSLQSLEQKSQQSFKSDSASRAEWLVMLGQTAAQGGDRSLAETLYKEVLHRYKLKNEEANTAFVELVENYRWQFKLFEISELCKEMIELNRGETIRSLMRRMYGDTVPGAYEETGDLGMHGEQYDSGAMWYTKALICYKAHGADEPAYKQKLDYALCLAKFSRCILELGFESESSKYLNYCMNIANQSLRKNDEKFAAFLLEVSFCFESLGRTDDATSGYERAEAIYSRSPKYKSELATVKMRRAEMLLSSDNEQLVDRAIRLASEAVDLCGSSSEDELAKKFYRITLAKALVKANRKREAEPILAEFYGDMERLIKSGKASEYSEVLSIPYWEYGRILLEKKQYPEAETVLRRARICETVSRGYERRSIGEQQLNAGAEILYGTENEITDQLRVVLNKAAALSETNRSKLQSLAQSNDEVLISSLQAFGVSKVVEIIVESTLGADEKNQLVYNLATALEASNIASLRQCGMHGALVQSIEKNHGFTRTSQSNVLPYYWLLMKSPGSAPSKLRILVSIIATLGTLDRAPEELLDDAIKEFNITNSSDPDTQRCGVALAYNLAFNRRPVDGAKITTSIAQALSERAAVVSSEQSTILRQCAEFFLTNNYFAPAQEVALILVKSGQSDIRRKLDGEYLLAEIALKQRDFAEAFRRTDSCLKCLEQLPQSEALSWRASVLVIRATAESARNPDSAIKDAEAALSLQRQAKQPDEQMLSETMLLIGENYQKKGQYQQALKRFDEARSLLEHNGDVLDQLMLARAYMGLGNCYLKSKNYEAAEGFLGRAFDIFGKDPTPVSVPLSVVTMDDLAAANYGLGKKEEAHAIAVSASKRLDRYVREVLPQLSFAEQSAFVSIATEHSRKLIGLLADSKQSRDAYTYAMRWKGLLQEALREQSALISYARSNGKSDLAERLARKRRSVELNRFSEQSSISSEDILEVERLEKELPKLREAAGVTDPLIGFTYRDIGKELSANECYVDMFEYSPAHGGKSRYGVFISTRDDAGRFVDLDEVEMLNEEIRIWRSCTARAGAAARDIRPIAKQTEKVELQKADEAWKTIKATIQKKILSLLPEDKSRLIVSEDGAMCTLPWTMLLTELLPQRNDLQVANSGGVREYVLLKKESSNGTKENLSRALLVGNVDFGIDGPSPLSATVDELRSLERLCATYSITPQVLEKELPTRLNVLRGLNNADIVHFATHGFFSSDKNALSERNVLQDSGIFVARAQPSESGRLTAQDIVTNAKLKCDLATLSACQTGLGDIVSGQGVLGLRSAIMAAGSRSVLVSLWSVNDKATAELMTAFYNNWLKEKMDKARALQLAQATIKEKYPNPYFWAGWALAGQAWGEHK